MSTLHDDVRALLERHPEARVEEIQQLLEAMTPKGPGFIITQTSDRQYDWTFEHPDSLRAQLHDVFKTQAVCVQLPQEVTLLDDVRLRLVLGEHSETFTGRVVHVTPEHVAIQVRPDHPQAQQRLERACEAWSPSPAAPPGQLTLQAEQAPLNTWSHLPVTLDVLLVAGRQPGPHRLDIQGEHGTSTLWCDGEDILAVQTPQVPDPMERVLTALEFDERALELAAQDAQHLGLSLATSLVDRGLLNQNVLRASLSTEHKALLEGILDEVHAVKIRHVALPHLGRRRQADALNMYAAVFGYLRAQVAPGSLHDDAFKHARFQYIGDLELLGRMMLEDREQRLMEAIAPKLTTFFDLHRFTSLAKQDIHALLNVMIRLGLVARAEHDEDEVTQYHEQRRDASFAQLVQSIEHGTHFDALGVHWTSHARAIHAGYREQLQRLDAHAEAPKHHALQEAVQRAYRALCDPEGRAAYRRTILDDYTIRMATQVLFTRLEGAQLKFDDQTVRECATTILELNPSDPQIRARLKSVV